MKKLTKVDAELNVVIENVNTILVLLENRNLASLLLNFELNSIDM